MKTQLQNKIMAMVAFFSFIGFANAQTTVTTFTEFKSIFASMAETGGDIIIGTPITIDNDFQMVANSPVTIATANVLSVSAGTLTLGNNVTINATVNNAISAMNGGNVIVENGCVITSTSTAPLNTAGGTITVNGGTISTSNHPAATAGSSLGSGGTLTINGGSLTSTNGGSLPRGIIIDYNGICYINGGEVHADVSANGRGVSINGTNAGGKLYVTGGTITAIGASGRAIQLDNNNSFLSISKNPTITGGLEAIMLQKNGVGVIQGSPALTGTIGTNTATSKLYDARSLGQITATPSAGHYTTDQEVTLSVAAGSVNKYVNTTTTPTTVSASLVYTLDGSNPIAASTVYSAPFTISMPTTVIAALLMESTLGVSTKFEYTLGSATGISSVENNTGKINSLVINTIDLSNIDGVQNAVVYDLNGRVVLHANNQTLIDATSLKSGIYVVKVKTLTSILVQRIVKK